MNALCILELILYFARYQMHVMYLCVPGAVSSFVSLEWNSTHLLFESCPRIARISLRERVDRRNKDNVVLGIYSHFLQARTLWELCATSEVLLPEFSRTRENVIGIKSPGRLRMKTFALTRASGVRESDRLCVNHCRLSSRRVSEIIFIRLLPGRYLDLDIQLEYFTIMPNAEGYDS